MGTIIGLITFAITAFASPAAYANFKLTKQRQTWALARVSGEPRIFVGARLRSLQETGRDSPVLENCTITSLELGRIELQDDDGLVTTFTNEEFEKMIWIFEVKGR